MKTKQIIILVVLLTISAAAVSFAGKTRFIEGFSSSKTNKFPRLWRTRSGQKDKAEKMYKVVEEGRNKYLSAEDPSGISVQIFKLASWDLEKYPILKWKWRARKLPKGANETIPSKNDSACGLYVSFGMTRGNALKYVWSSTAPKGTFYKKNDKMTIIVKESGDPGKWVWESTNLMEDAKKAFGKVPDRTISGIGILTDGNATKSPAACDYDSIGYASLPEETTKTASEQESK